MFLNWSHEHLLHSLEGAMAKHGGVIELDQSSPESVVLSVTVRTCERWAIASYFLSYVLLSLTKIAVTSLNRQSHPETWCIGLIGQHWWRIHPDQFVALLQVTLENLVGLVYVLSVYHTTEKTTNKQCWSPKQTTMPTPQWVTQNNFLVMLVTSSPFLFFPLATTITSIFLSFSNTCLP